MIRYWDGFLSLFGAVLTLGFIGPPLYAAFRAVQGGLVPTWFWAPMLALGFIGLVMVGAFLRKAGRGIHPLRERRR
ncbi:MAG: hypothetical protein AAF762_06690 [Pseudomonadota bacterium]